MGISGYELERLLCLLDPPKENQEILWYVRKHKKEINQALDTVGYFVVPVGPGFIIKRCDYVV